MGVESETCMRHGREKQCIPVVHSGVSRQLPFEKFQAMLVSERQALSASHARDAGRALAEALVGRRQKLSDLNEEARQRALKRYGVPANLGNEFFAACIEAYEFERSFQLNCVN